MFKALVVDDDAGLRLSVKSTLDSAGGAYEVDEAFDGVNALEKLEETSYNIVLLDVDMPRMTGLEALKHIKEKDPATIVIIMTAFANIDDAVRAVKEGAYNYISKPVKSDELLAMVEKAMEAHNLISDVAQSAPILMEAGRKIIGNTAQMRKVFNIINRLSKVDTPVLIRGASGTGKELVARAIHSNSANKSGKFVAINCSAIPENLFESELFGHEKGAFTNANNARAGLIEAAEDGVLFLDEVAEIPIDLQSKLLGVLERRSLRRIGSTKERPIAAWIIAATNRNIESLVKNGEFRSDLYYRLNVMAITIPALRERDNDVVMLGNYYAEATSKRYGLSFDGFSKGALRQIKEYSWYGNVRELKHLIERAVLLSGGGLLDENMLGIDKNIGNNDETEINDDITLGEAELHLIKTALERTNRNVSKAARELGITRMALRYRIRKYNL